MLEPQYTMVARDCKYNDRAKYRDVVTGDGDMLGKTQKIDKGALRCLGGLGNKFGNFKPRWRFVMIMV